MVKGRPVLARRFAGYARPLDGQRRFSTNSTSLKKKRRSSRGGLLVRGLLNGGSRTRRAAGICFGIRAPARRGGGGDPSSGAAFEGRCLNGSRLGRGSGSVLWASAWRRARRTVAAASADGGGATGRCTRHRDARCRSNGRRLISCHDGLDDSESGGRSGHGGAFEGRTVAAV